MMVLRWYLFGVVWVTCLSYLGRQCAFLHCSLSYNCLALPSLGSLKAENEVLFISKCIAYHTVGTEQTLDKCHAIKYQLFHEGCLAYYQLNVTFPDHKPRQHSAFTSLRAAVPYLWLCVHVNVWLCVYVCTGVWPPGQQGSVGEENKDAWTGSPALFFPGHLV